MKTIAIALTASAFTIAPNTTSFDANKESVLSGFQIVCPDAIKPDVIYTPTGLKFCGGVQLIAPPGHAVIIQYNLY